jgi:hypothetical protein
MNRKMLVRLGASSLVTACGALPGLSGCDVAREVGCPEFSEEGDFGARLELDADVRAFMVASGRIQVLAEQMIADVGVACVDIALAAGRSPAAWAGKEGPQLVQAACAEAEAGIRSAFESARGASLAILVDGGQCSVRVEAAADCFARCDVSGECSPGELEVQCEPGKLAGRCEGACNGSCEGGTVACHGTCSATCTGRCAGDCVGTCDGRESPRGACAGECIGQCTGSCDGSCNGSCEYQQLSCEGTCTGQCSGELKAPHCTGNVTPPSCDLDADCKAACEASVQAEASCTPPRVGVKIVGEGTRELALVAEALATHLPVLVQAGFERGQALVEAVASLAESGKEIASAAGELTLKAGVCAAVAAEAAVTASIHIEVSVQASASISTAAGARVVQ